MKNRNEYKKIRIIHFHQLETRKPKIKHSQIWKLKTKTEFFDFIPHWLKNTEHQRGTIYNMGFMFE